MSWACHATAHGLPASVAAHPRCRPVGPFASSSYHRLLSRVTNSSTLLNGGSLRQLKQHQLHLSRKLHNWKKLPLPDIGSPCLLEQMRVTKLAPSTSQHKRLRFRQKRATCCIDVEEQYLRFYNLLRLSAIHADKVPQTVSLEAILLGKAHSRKYYQQDREQNHHLDKLEQQAI